MYNLIIDLTGQRFGRLVVIEISNRRTKWRVARWLCKCDCGNLIEADGHNLRRGHIKSCGCFRKEKMREQTKKNKPAYKHGATGMRIHEIWLAMKKRCYYQAGHNFRWYGKRGIKVCPEWRNNFSVFYDWAITNGYADNLVIDRIDNDGNYEPLNCQWITQSENSKRNWK